MSFLGYRIVIFGSVGVGKSALLIQYINNHFIDEYDPSIEDSYRKQIFVEEETCTVDTAGYTEGEEETLQRTHYIKSAHGFLIVYSVSSPSSFTETHKIREILRRKAKPRVPMVLVGNKKDLFNERKISFAQGQQLANSFGCPFIETSAKTRENIEKCFYDIVVQIRRNLDGRDRMNVVNGKRKKKKKGCFIM